MQGSGDPGCLERLRGEKKTDSTQTGRHHSSGPLERKMQQNKVMEIATSGLVLETVTKTEVNCSGPYCLVL